MAGSGITGLGVVTTHDLRLDNMYGNHGVMAIREVIQDELAHSLRMEKSYAVRLKQLPRGNLIKKRIKGREYWYLQIRDGQKVRFEYVKKPSSGMIARYAKAKESRKKYRSLLAQVREQVRQMRKMLKHGQSI